jgi:hypothetical protein
MGLKKENKNKDAIAQRIEAIDNATFGMNEDLKKEIIIEALKGSTNSVAPVSIELEKK